LAATYPKAEKIRLVQDKVSTHNASAFYEHLPAEAAFQLAGRFEFYYTPVSASWLNRIEIEFSALVRQCLNQRIPTPEQLRKEIGAIVKERIVKSRSKSTGSFPLKKQEQNSIPPTLRLMA
jgi:hypothetical protein